MKEIDTSAGEHIRQAAQRLVDAVRIDGDCFATFNGICLPANQFSTVESLCADYDRLCKVRRKEYEASPEGKEFKSKQAADQKRLQDDADRLMKDLPHLDFQNVGNLLHWLCAMEEPRDRVGVTVDTQKIRWIFAKNGFTANMNCGDEFDENDRETFAKWIIGQAIADVYVPMTRHFTEQWAEKFPRGAK